MIHHTTIQRDNTLTSKAFIHFGLASMFISRLKIATVKSAIAVLIKDTLLGICLHQQCLITSSYSKSYQAVIRHSKDVIFDTSINFLNPDPDTFTNEEDFFPVELTPLPLDPYPELELEDVAVPDTPILDAPATPDPVPAAPEPALVLPSPALLPDITQQ